MEVMSQFQERFQKFIEVEGLTGEQLYNCDEPELHFKLLPAKTLAFNEEQSAPGFKWSE